MSASGSLDSLADVRDKRMQTDAHVVLINPPSLCVEDDRVEPPLGLLYIAAVLRDHGYEDVTVHDMSGCPSEEQISFEIANLPGAGIYGVSSLCTNYLYAKRIIERIRSADCRARVIIGGPNPTGIPGFIAEDSGADVVVAGEGEDPFVICVDAYSRGIELKGIVTGHGRNDIDSYPFPARDLVDMETYSRRLMGEPVVSLISSRGCKSNCIHCNSPVMGAGSRGARYRSTGNLFAEIETLRPHFRCFRFNDDHFTGNPDLETLLKQMKNLEIRFRVFGRIEDLTDSSCRLLKDAGCVHITLGLESLNPDNLRVLGKGSQIGLESNIAVAKSHGLHIRASFIVGLPYDSDDSIPDCFERAAGLGIDEFAVYPLIPYPGSLLWQSPGKFGYCICNRDFTDYVQMGLNGKTCYALKHENFGLEDVRRWKSKAENILTEGGARHMRDSCVAA